jgi:hypothetical protein
MVKWLLGRFGQNLLKTPIRGKMQQPFYAKNAQNG